MRKTNYYNRITIVNCSSKSKKVVKGKEMAKNSKLKQLRIKDPRLTIDRIMNIFTFDSSPYISLVFPSKDFNADDPIFNFIFDFLMKNTNEPNKSFSETVDEIKNDLAKIYHLPTPVVNFSKMNLGKLQRATGINLDRIQLVLSGATYNDDNGYLLDLRDAVNYGFVNPNENSAFANLTSYRRLQDMLIRAMINDGVHIYQTIDELVDASHGVLKKEELSNLPDLCLNEQRYLAVKDMLMLLIDSNPIKRVKKALSFKGQNVVLQSSLVDAKMILPPDQNPVFMPRKQLQDFVDIRRQRQVYDDSKTVAAILTNEAEKQIDEMAKMAGFSRSKIFAEVINAVHLVEMSDENLENFEKMYSIRSYPMQVRPNHRLNYSIPNSLFDKYNAVKKGIQDYEMKKNNLKRYYGYIIFFINAFYVQFNNYDLFQ